MLRIPWRSRWWRGLLAIVLGAPLLLGVLVFWRASSVRDQAAAEVRSQSQFSVRITPIGQVVPSSVDPIAASPGFRDLAVFQDTIAVSARAGLFLYNREGALVHSYRAGMELPPAEFGSLSVGMAAGSSQRELFVATHGEGLLAFDGSRFRQILPDDAELRNVTAVLALASGRIVLGTEHRGLLVFDGQRFLPFHPRLKSSHITALAGNDGDLWIGTLESGLFHYRGGQLDDLAASLPDQQVLSLTAEGAFAYAGTPLGVVEFHDAKRTRILAEGFCARAIALRGDTLHVGTQDEGIVDVPVQPQSRPSSHVFSNTSAPSSPVLRIANLEGQAYALGESAIYRYDSSPKRWREVLNAGTAVLADRNVAALAWNAGRLWVGYFDRGLDLLDANLEHATHHEDDTLFCINRIVPGAGDPRIAVATANGLVMFDSTGQPRQILGRKDGLLADHITDVAFRDGGMVVATPAGLSFIDRGGIRSLYVFHGLVNNHVYTVAAQGNQTVAGTLGGLSLLDDDTVRRNYTTANSHLKHNWITAIVRVGDEWFAGTYGAGVLRLDRAGEWRSFADVKDGFVVNPNAMLVTEGQVYAGSLDRGLFVFNRASSRWTRTTKGMPSKNVTALASGGGNIFVGTDNGVVRISEGALR